MESKRFDDLSRAVATMSSRRGVLKGIVAGAVAGVIGIAGSRDTTAAARKRGRGQVCRKPGDCQDTLTCIPDGHSRNRCCPVDSTWCDGVCCETLCSPDFGCADPYTDVQCYQDCVNKTCYSINYTTINYGFNNQLQCEQYCAYEVCGNVG